MCRSTGKGTITLLENNFENENLNQSPMASSFRTVLTSAGEQRKEQLQISELQIQSPLPILRWRGWISFACLLHYACSDYFPLDAARF